MTRTAFLSGTSTRISIPAFHCRHCPWWEAGSKSAWAAAHFSPRCFKPAWVVLERLLTKGIGHTKFKETELGPIPQDWEVKSLGDIAEFINGRGFKPHEWGTQGLPIIRIQNLNGSSTFNYYDGPYAAKLVVSSGDLLFAWSGSRGSSFGPHIWRGPRGLLNYHTWRVRLYEPRDRDFLYYALRKLTRTVEADSHGASALVHMQKNTIVDYRIPFPPEAERDSIIEVLRSADTAIASLENELFSFRSTKSALISDLLTGRKRVNDALPLAAE
jgi:type I restriction enzyme S subunit